MKRKRTDGDTTLTPSKLRYQVVEDDTEASQEEDIEAETPSKRRRSQRARRRDDESEDEVASEKVNGINGHATPKSQRKVLFATPSKADHDDTLKGTPTIVRNADRSARRKSTRRMIERAVNDAESDDEALDEENTLAGQILSDEDEDEEEQDDAQDNGEEGSPVPETPSKRGRGRAKSKGKPWKQRSPTPPQNLPPHEQYFWQNRPGGSKTSNNTLSSQTLLDHDEYFTAMQSYNDRHDQEMEFLLELHSRAFDQWIFELQEGFNICLYGYGSKRPLIEEFVRFTYDQLSDSAPYRGSKKKPKIIVINGYAPGITIKDILATLCSTIVPSNLNLPSQPASLLAFVLNHLTEDPPLHPVPVILNSIDSPSLRKASTPSMLAQLAAHPSVNLVCTADTPNFPLLWDVGQRAQFRFLFHDATTFAPYDAEIDVVETVNELLGRSGRRVGGRDGVAFVLRSLPENARSLFRILVAEQLPPSDGDPDAEAEEDDLDMTATPRRKTNGVNKRTALEVAQGVEYRVLYHKAVQQFVCSNEVGFRTLLKEFYDHQMVESRKDAMGTERLWVPFRQEELESLAEELVAEGI